MNAIKIDSLRKTVELIQIVNSLQGMYTALGEDMIEIPAYFDNGDALVVDEEALVRARRPDEVLGGFFCQAFPHQILFGHGLIVGSTEDGDNTHCQSTVEQIRSQIIFADPLLLRHNWRQLTGEDGSTLFPFPHE